LTLSSVQWRIQRGGVGAIAPLEPQKDESSGAKKREGGRKKEGKEVGEKKTKGIKEKSQSSCHFPFLLPCVDSLAGGRLHHPA
jgi:hypothetical protein